MKLFLLTLIYSHISIICQASEVIELGTLQVQGEVRRPGIQSVRAGQIPQTLLKQIAKESFQGFEHSLLKTKRPNILFPKKQD